ncbi:precorrin-2 C(20)-methyltransferase [Propylenella binzhouense]|uniref:Precorrin-2 C(20)-methyltransferase n=1 Tax=Propylenella binzhouense TaxID=2555902 RepID=A0A964T3W0_9HYPH|nr:precorrin-2 C(20)-methyltransferase [Propylenella binzhouense]MYZ48011.1 precorrin-2 C(20)-methyltransferase [Propylenella binzhouense]
MTGRLYGIGVGPGDPELMTLKAVRVLAAVPVVAYPAANDGPSLARSIAAAHIPAGRTEIAIRVPMRAGEPPESVYDAAADAIAAHLEADRDVAVLCEGDPLFYGSFAYLHDRLSAFPATIVPGVTSLSACAAAAARALARREEMLAVLPATLPDAALEARLAEGGAAAIMKVGRHLPRIAALLVRMGLAGDALYVAQASRPEEAVLPLAAALEEGRSGYFATILVGGGGA